MDLKEGVIISDAGSTKSAIVDAAENYLAGKPVRFVGAHPMAGSHKTGAASADVNLFFLLRPSTDWLYEAHPYFVGNLLY